MVGPSNHHHIAPHPDGLRSKPLLLQKPPQDPLLTVIHSPHYRHGWIATAPRAAQQQCHCDRLEKRSHDLRKMG
jgi:hypothetical protein